MKIQLDMYQTIAVAVVVLMLGKFLKERVELLERFCIPAPVIGGVIFAIFTCLCYDAPDLQGVGKNGYRRIFF